MTPKSRQLRMQIAALSLVLASLFTAPALACPNCKESTPETGSTMTATAPPVARGYFWSILFMLTVPATLVGGMGVGFYFALRKNGLNAATPAQSSQSA